MRYLIIGLGIYGSNLAIDLTNVGNEVIGADSNASIVEGLKDYMSTTYILDSTDESALQLMPLNNVDVVIVAIGENFGASVRTVALLKKFGVAHIYARAVDPLHQAILEGFHVDRILTPEQRAASDLVLEMGLGSKVGTLSVCPDGIVVKCQAPRFFNGLRYADLDWTHTDSEIKLIAAFRQVTNTNIIGMSSTKQIRINPEKEIVDSATDTVLLFGTADSLKSLIRKIN